MGNGTPLLINKDMARRINQSADSIHHAHRPRQLHLDVPLLLIVITLLVFGLLMVYSASWDYSLMVLGREPTYMFVRQLTWFGVGIGVIIFLAFFNYRYWQKLAVYGMIAVTGALVLVLGLNQVVNNATRTLIGGSVQPSEAAKLIIIIYLSVWLYAKRDQLSDINFGLIPLAVILGFIGGLIFIQPDLSAATTIFILGGILFFLAGGDLRQIAILLLISLVVGWLVFRLHPTGRIRMDAYLIGLSDLTKSPDHLSRALEAIVKGGWFGAGIGRATTKLTGLPVPPTDSIFAVIAEETGIFGSTCVIILYALLVWRGLLIAQRAPDGLGRLMAAGLTLWIGIEAYINMAVIVGLVPFAGNALPFISAGGSNLVISMAAVGILLNISRMTAKSREEDERTFDAVVDLRWRNGRRNISRPKRTAKHAG